MYKTHALDLYKEIISDRGICAFIGVLFFVVATALGAYVRIPINASPVPITLQTFFVILSGAILGRRLAGWSQLAYLAFGGVGLPIFQSFSFGIPYLFGPTGGYLIGFVLAAYFIGRMIDIKGSGPKWIIASFIAGDFIIHISGILWLSYLHKMHLSRAVLIGILPFIPGEIIKISFAAVIYSKLSLRAKNIFSA